MSSIPLLPAAAVLEDHKLLSEILLRLPPQPSSLPRASLVCKRWRSVVADPGLTRRFRLRHRRNPPLLGVFGEHNYRVYFIPTMEGPNRVPAGRFLQMEESFVQVLGCRHGLVLLSDASLEQVLVWDPVTADKHHIHVPARFGKAYFHGAVLRAPGDDQHFQVVLTVVDDKDKQHRQALACVYSSETGVWGELVSAPLPPKAPTSNHGAVYMPKPAVLAENSLYWILAGDFVGILRFDLERKNIAVIQPPVDVLTKRTHRYTVVRAEGGGLGLLFVSHRIAQLWKRVTDCGGVSFWVLDKTIELDKLLPPNTYEGSAADSWILGFAENNNVVFLLTYNGIFMINLKSLQFEEHPTGYMDYCNHPFESVYAAGI